MRFRPGLLFQLFKYSVYGLLTLNVFLFFFEEHGASTIRYADGLTAALLFEAYAATIDTAAWVILLLVFELETYVLDDRHFTPAVDRSLVAIRAVCFAFILVAFFGYLQTTAAAYRLALEPGVTDLCSVADSGELYATSDSDFAQITADNCATLSDASEFRRFADSNALVDGGMAVHIQRLSWVDVINAGVWILIVILLEIDVRLQERNRFEGAAYKTSMALKGVFYPTLFLAAIYWGIRGDFVDFWDAFLWLVAFLFIENNIQEWRDEANTG